MLSLRNSLAFGLGLLTFAGVSEAHAANNAYVCEVTLGVSEDHASTGSWGGPISFWVSLTTQPFCGGDGLPGAEISMAGQYPGLSNDYNSVLSSATTGYENSALMGAFMRLQTAAALGLKINQLSETSDGDHLSMRFGGLTIANVPNGSRPLGETVSNPVSTTHRGYVCSSEGEVGKTYNSNMAMNHRLKMTLRAGPGCTGEKLYDADLRPQTVSGLPSKIRNLAYEQARQQQFNLATVALGHAFMMAEVGRMRVTVQENTTTGELTSVTFRAIPLNTCKVSNKIPKTKWVPPKISKEDWVLSDRLPSIEKKPTQPKSPRTTSKGRKTRKPTASK